MAADRQLRDLFDAEIRRIDQILSEREKQTNIALGAAQRAIEKADTEAERVRLAQNEWRGAMNDRETKFVRREEHDLLEGQVDYLRRAADAGAGRRTAWVAAAGIITTLIAIGIGQLLTQGLTAADVSQQIQREAPWNKDKDQIERRITKLEHQEQVLEIQIQKLQQQILLLNDHTSRR